MRASLRRAADHERSTAREIGSRRTAVIGSRRREQDIATIQIAGEPVVPECKRRKRAPKVIVDGLRQAAGYKRGAVPLVVIREDGGESVACLWLSDFCRFVGLEPAQLPTRHRSTPRDPRQTEMFQ